MSVYLDLTREFNEGGLRAVLSSGQAVVMHRLAVMSKDGDWIVREEPDDLEAILSVLERHAAHYRFGAPLDVRWMAGGWSSHLEFRMAPLRVRTDFVTRPPRLSRDRLASLWREQAGRDLPFVGVGDLAELKKTNREKDYPVIGELARLLSDPTAQLLLSRSARDIQALAHQHPELISGSVEVRPLLALAGSNRGALEAALDAERRTLMHANERRLSAYMAAAQDWRARWPAVAKEIVGLATREAHAIVAARAEGVLPFTVQTEDA